MKHQILYPYLLVLPLSFFTVIYSHANPKDIPEEVSEKTPKEVAIAHRLIYLNYAGNTGEAVKD